MRLIHLLESSVFHQIEGRIAVGTSETRKRFQKFVEWLCECIKQDLQRILSRPYTVSFNSHLANSIPNMSNNS